MGYFAEGSIWLRYTSLGLNTDNAKYIRDKNRKLVKFYREADKKYLESLSSKLT